MLENFRANVLKKTANAGYIYDKTRGAVVTAL